MPLDLDWPWDLHYRRGSWTRLDDLDVYYDFEWLDYLADERAQFRNGQSLAKRVRAECPPDKTPVLLLTDDEDADEGFVETPEHLVFILNLPRYLDTEADASLSYLAHRLGHGISQLGPLNQETAARARAGGVLLGPELDLRQITAWAEGDAERLAQLREIAGSDAERDGPSDIDGLVAALDALSGELDPKLLEAITRLFGSRADPERRRELVQAIADDPSGRYLIAQVFSERSADRVEDARAALTEYEALLHASDTTETAMQAFIEEHPWLLGLDYSETRPQQPGILGAMDFLLERFDGFHDLLELKSPQDEIIRVRTTDGSTAPPASAYSLSPDLAKAVAQVHVYRDRLTRYE